MPVRDDFYLLMLLHETSAHRELRDDTTFVLDDFTIRRMVEMLIRVDDSELWRMADMSRWDTRLVKSMRRCESPPPTRAPILRHGPSRLSAL